MCVCVGCSHSNECDFVDVGGESTRPGADEVSAVEEVMRILPVLERLRDMDIPVNINCLSTIVNILPTVPWVCRILC